MGSAFKKLSLKRFGDTNQSEAVEFLVDSGAIYSVVPGVVLARLGITPNRKLDFTLADGAKVERKVGDAFFEFEGSKGAAPVIFGEEGDHALLGVTTLECLGLVLNPFRREIYPMQLIF